MPYNDPEIELVDSAGSTSLFVNTVNTTAVDLPSVAGNRIEELWVNCPSDQASSRRLLFSIDGGSTWVTLMPGEMRYLEPRGFLTQIKVKSAGGDVDYNVTMNLGQV